jgi:hypothetical protein
MCAKIGVNNSSEKTKNQTKNTATTGKLSKAIYASYVYVYIWYKVVRSSGLRQEG